MLDGDGVWRKLGDYLVHLVAALVFEPVVVLRITVSLRRRGTKIIGNPVKGKAKVSGHPLHVAGQVALPRVPHQLLDFPKEGAVLVVPPWVSLVAVRRTRPVLKVTAHGVEGRDPLRHKSCNGLMSFGVHGCTVSAAGVDLPTVLLRAVLPAVRPRTVRVAFTEVGPKPV